MAINFELLVKRIKEVCGQRMRYRDFMDIIF